MVKEEDPSLKYQKNSWNFWLKSAGEIAMLFGVSKRTVQRRLNEIGVSVKESYAIQSASVRFKGG